MMSKSKLNSATLALIAILLAFVLALVFIWLWYDLKIHSLEKQKKPAALVQSTRYSIPTPPKPTI